MNLFDNSTYPPTITTTPPPPPTHTASTGAPASISWMVPAIIILVIVGALALRLVRRTP